MSWDHDTWVKAWGSNLPLICGGVGEEHLTDRLPKLPEAYDWLLTRSITGEHPTYCLALCWSDPDNTENFKAIARGKIDKTFYGEAGVVELARHMREKHG